MIMQQRTFVLFFLSLSLTSLFAQTGETIPMDPAVRSGVLSNGLRYFIKTNARPEKRVELRLAVNTGSIMEDDDQLGLAHFVEHMAFNGTTHFQKNDLISYLQSAGVKFGAHINAYTSFDETVYMLTLPSDKQDIIHNGFLILEDWAHGITFDSLEIEKERGVVIEEWRTGIGAQQRMRDQYWPKLFYGSRYAERMPIGKKEILEKFSHASIQRFYKDWYRPELMSVIAVGDIQPDSIEYLIRKHFSNIATSDAKKVRPRNDFSVPPHKETWTAVVRDKEAPNTMAQIFYKHPSQTVRSVQDYRTSLLRTLYTGMLNKRMEELTQQANPPFVFGGAFYGNFVRATDVYAVYAGTGETTLERGLLAVLIENRRAQQHGFSRDEMEDYKKEILSNYESSYNNRDKVLSSSLADEFVEYALTAEAAPGMVWEYETVKRLLPTITVDEIHALAAQWITTENRIGVVTAPQNETVKLPDEARLLALIDSVATIQTAPYVYKTVLVPLLATLPHPGKIVKTKKLKEIAAEEWTLSNGMKVILKPTTYMTDEIKFSAYSFGGWSRGAPSQDMSAIYGMAPLGEGGIAEFSKTDLEKILSGKNVSVSTGIRMLSETISGQSLKKDMETMFQLIYLNFTAPRLDTTVFYALLSRQMAYIKNIDNDPRFVFSNELNRVISRDHPRDPSVLRRERFSEINPQTALTIYRDRFAEAGDFVMTIVGSFEIATIRPFVERYLAGLPTTGRKETFKDLGIRRPDRNMDTTIYRGVDPRAQVNMQFHGALKKYDDLFLLRATAMLLTNKLIENLREDKGGVYGTSANAYANKYPVSNYAVIIGFSCAPERLDSLIGAVHEEIRKLAENGPAESDVNKIRETLRRDLERNQKENAYWLRWIESAYYENASIKNITPEAQEKLISRLSAKDIRKIAQKYIQNGHTLIFKMRPEEKK